MVWAVLIVLAIQRTSSCGTFGDLPEDNPVVRRGWELYHGL